jgi:hypothetical protein
MDVSMRTLVWLGDFASAYLGLERQQYSRDGRGAVTNMDHRWMKLLSFSRRTLVRFDEGQRCSTEVLWRTADSSVRKGNAVMVVVASSDAASFLSSTG